MSTNVKPRTVKLIARFIRPLCEEGLLSVPEMNEILGNLKNLAAKGEMLPAVQPKLIDQREAAEMLSVGLSNFKKLEKSGMIPFKRKMVGSAVRYRNTDVIKYLLANDGEGDAPAEDAATATDGKALRKTA